MRRAFFDTAVVLCAVIGTTSSTAPSKAAGFPTDDRSIVHALGRLGFGPRPGDVAKVRAIGLQRYIDQQLHPEQVPDPATNARVAGLATLSMSSREIAGAFEIPQLLARRQQQLRAGQNGVNAPPPPSPEMQRANNQPLLQLSENKLLRATYGERQLQEVLVDFWFNHFNVDARKGRDRFLLTEYERDTIRPHVLGRFRDLVGATAKSPAMLFYLDNWMSADPEGPHLEGFGAGRRRFGPGAFGAGGALPATADQTAGARQKRGLNENYGRELLELHTLGVDAGYTQKDVTEVARAFTGWTIENPRQGGGYRFDPRVHDPGEKIVLGHTIKAGGGERDGEEVLDILARHPATAHFIAAKLVRRFVSDAPPEALVQRAAARYRATDGDLREVMRTIVTSPEFFAPEAYRAKIKTPLEFVIGAMRATGAEVSDAMSLVRTMQQLGMPLYSCQPPTGYKDTAEAWVNTGALVARMNVALALANNQLRGITVDLSCTARDQDCQSDPGAGLDVSVASRERLIASLINGEISDATRATIARAANVPQLAALILGSPEFQRR